MAKTCESYQSPYYPKAGNGLRTMNILMMIKIYCLQQWYNLSDPAMEEAIYDRMSFQEFLKLDLMIDRVPNETTILKFRNLLKKHNLTAQIFTTIDSKCSGSRTRTNDTRIMIPVL
jgi:IS5 family transposase